MGTATSKLQDDDTTSCQDPSLKSMEVEITQPANQVQTTTHDSPCVVSSSSEAVDENDMVESESSSSEASDSSMSESTGNSERGSIEPEPEPEPQPEPEPEQHVPQSQPSNAFPLSQEVSADLASAERPVLQDLTTVAKPLEEASSLHESTVVPGNEALEVEDSADEAYSPKLDAIADDEEMDTSSISSSSHCDADMKLTPKFQEQVVMASKNDALDVRRSWSTAGTY